MLERKSMRHLLEWKQTRQGATALLIEGARRVGKSTLVEEFAKRHYRSYLLIDFARIPDEVADLFRNLRTDLDKFFLYLSAYYRVTLHPRESLIIFDEVQTFPLARAFVKYLVADGRYDYIETGVASLHSAKCTGHRHSFRRGNLSAQSLGLRGISLRYGKRAACPSHWRGFSKEGGVA